MLFRNLAISLVLAASAGCTSLPAYNLKAKATHKDVLSVSIFLEARVPPEVYQRIALRELSRIQAEGRWQGLPLYEIQFEFQKARPQRERLARVTLRLPSGLPETDGAAAAFDRLAHGPPPASEVEARIETTLY